MSGRKPYYIVKNTDIYALEREIVRLISFGYLPHGNLVHDGRGYLQPMIDRTINTDMESLNINTHENPENSDNQYP